jgi:two-component system CheB/CheR fusion protein
MNGTTSSPEGALVGPQTDGALRPSFIVGIGASAGGLEALEQLFEKMPARTGMAFIVVQHLSPDFKSLTNVLLARRTSIPIHCVENGMEVRPDAIYLIPPKMDMIIANGKLLLTDKDPTQLMTMPIDHFFRSLAQEAGNHSIGIILSGTGSDGSRGIREIHDAGGVVIVQKPESAQFDGMPNSAEKTGIVDSILTPEEMPEALLRYATGHEEGLSGHGKDEAVSTQEKGLEALFRILRDSYGIDFAYYRPATVDRRIERRLQISGAASLTEYTRRLEKDAEEVNALYKDLLIGVTRFMRDSDAFEKLASVIPELVQPTAEKGEEFRVWVAGCATGEEAYSMAILIREALDALGKEIPVKIFATDVHRASLEFASAALYPEAALSEMSAERLARFFIRTGASYHVTPELRKMVVFAPHNVIKDAPFTKLHLVTCRNLLIYLQPNAQKKVISLFHFGLKTGGILFLGPSESVGELSDEFDLVDTRWKILRKRRDVRLFSDLRVSTPIATNKLRPFSVNAPMSGLLEGQLFAAYNALLNKYVPPSLLVNSRRELVQSFAGANRYLKHKEGLYSPDILEMVDQELRTALTGALQRVLNDRKPVAYKAVRIPLSDGPVLVNVMVEPIQLQRHAECFALISLEEIGVKPGNGIPVEEIKLDEASQEQMLSLETELRFTKENLQATIEELETSNEELQATNEELVAANEELQSTNEELHSVNEELYTVNAEYQNKIVQLTELTTDIENLLTSTDVHTVFLDQELRIRKFTPRIAETFNFLPQDVGRRIDTFSHTIDHPGLLDDLRAVLQTGTPIEKQVRDQKGNWFLMRVLPYRVGLHVEGVVLTLIDIAALKQLEAEATRKHQQLIGILNNSPNPIAITNREGKYVVTDGSFRQMLSSDPVGKTARDIFPTQAAEMLTSLSERVISEGKSVQAEVVIGPPDDPHTYLAILFPLQDEQGNPSGVGNIMTDVTPLKVAECRALEAVTQRDRFLAMLSHELRNPLAAILNATNAMERARSAGNDDGAGLQIINRRSRHMARLLDDLLDVARLTQNKIEIRRKGFDLATTLADVIEETQPWLKGRGIELTVNRSDVPLPVEGDPARLQQIQVNLLMNAAKYTPEGGHVWYSLQREEDQAVIRIRDNGRGIAPEMLGKVFDLFVQADSKPGQTDGIGVGLFMVRSIVEMHGGRVKAYSEGPGKGSEFIVWLPLVQDRRPEPRRPSGERSSLALDPRFAGCQVLLVEDDVDIREMLKSILHHDRFQVRAVPDGPSALAALEEAVPDVVLLDLGLPGMSGYELARLIRQRHPMGRLPLVALTGYGQTSDRQATREAGFNVHLTKPIKPMELYQTLALVLPDANGSRTEQNPSGR